jgi:hypothetical protein
VTITFLWQRILLYFATAAVLAACATGPQITKIQEVSRSADTPYRKILVIGLFSSFGSRKKFEKQVVTQLSERGTDAVASTSMMDTKTPVTRQTFLAMVDEIDADAVLVTQIADAESKTAMKDMSPQATYNVRPTYYYNVWDVELTEYKEPQNIEVKSSLILATQLFSVLNQESVWAIESKIKVVQEGDPGRNYTYYLDEARAIAAHLSSDGLIAP